MNFFRVFEYLGNQHTLNLRTLIHFSCLFMFQNKTKRYYILQHLQTEIVHSYNNRKKTLTYSIQDSNLIPNTIFS